MRSLWCHKSVPASLVRLQGSKDATPCPMVSIKKYAHTEHLHRIHLTHLLDPEPPASKAILARRGPYAQQLIWILLRLVKVTPALILPLRRYRLIRPS